MFRKYFVPALLACTAVLVVSCDEPDADVTFVTPTDGQRVAPGLVLVRIALSTYKVSAEELVLKVAGAQVGTMHSVSDTCDFQWDASGVAPGSKVFLTAEFFYRRSGDPEEITRSALDRVEVRVDTGGPDIRIVSPRDGDTLAKGGVPITAWARDTSAAGMDRVEFLVDDVLEGTDSTGDRDTWRYTWDASQASAGSHTIKAKAYNGYGEIAFEAASIAIKDTTSGGGPTYHHGYVDTNETWSPAGNPHIVDADVIFRSGAWLTIQPGCIVKFDNFNLCFGLFGPSGLHAVGNASAPILLTSNKVSPAPGDWTGIAFGESTLTGTRLSYCTIEYAGYAGIDGAAISILNRGTVTEIDNCTIRYSGRYGVFCRDYSEFTTFRNNIITSGLSYPLRIGPALAERLDDNNNLTGNDSNGVELAGQLTRSATWPNLGVPYVIYSVTVGDTTTEPVLTIGPGAEMRFRRTGSLYAGNTGATITGRIVANGSAGRIAFTSLSPTPAPGDFFGVRVCPGASTESEFRYCDFSYGGGTGDNGMLYVYNCSPTILGNDFGYSGGYGITFRTAQVPDTLTIRQQNTFHDNVGGAIKWIPPWVGR